jgi:serine/threonine protein kinase
MLAPDTVLQGRYRIVKQLGQGGMGAVYEAIDERLDTIVALKETLFADERLRKQFEREARLLARMHHPALPRVSDHFNEGDGEFLIMQFIAGDDLSAMLAQRKGPFPLAEVLKWADQLLDALDYLHTQDPQIVHRDIKPQNLKLTARGQIVLLDFGLAKGSVGQMSVVTTSASIYGYTPNYAPLEQVQGLGTDARSDLYSLSATIYHLTTGVKPPDALTRAAAIVNGQPDPLQPANEVALQVNSAVASVLAKAMAQNREQRYASANQMRDALRFASDSWSTVSNDEAATVLLPGAVVSATARTIASEEAATLAAERRTAMPAKPQVASSAETVTRVHAPDSRRGSGIWKLAAVALVLLACAGAFYGYRVIRNRSQANEVPAATSTSDSNAKPQPAAESSAAAPAVTESAAERDKKTNSTAPANQRAASAKGTAPKNPAVAAQNSNQAQRNEALIIPPVPNVNAEHPGTANVYPDPRQFPVNPNVPDDRAGRGRARMRGGVMIRTLPDGTQIMTQPDGTRIVRRPNGTTRVFGPGEKLNRKPFRP